MQEIKSIISELKYYEEKYNILSGLLVFLSVVSVNFASYISYYDFNVLSIIDLTTISKHILGIGILFTLLSASTSIIIFSINQYLSASNDAKKSFFNFRLPISEKKKKLLIEIIKNKSFKYTVTFFIFCIFYVGIEGTVFISLIFISYFFFIAVFIYSKEDIKPLRTDEENLLHKIINETFIEFFLISKNIPLIKKPVNFILKQAYKTFIAYSEAIEHIVRGNFIKFILSTFGIMLIFLSISLGVARAVYVENNIHVHINNKNLVLFMSTSYGVVLYDKTLSQVSFSSWESLSNLAFPSEKRQSIYKIINTK